MKNYLLLIFSTLQLFLVYQTKAQTCTGKLASGQNMVSNGDFSNGYTGWTHDPQYLEYTPCSNCYSVAGKIFVGTNPTNFNQAFPSSQDHSPSADNMFLMVDGVCTPGISLWEQDNIPVSPNTNYYFTVWITSIYTSTNLGKLSFNINGTDLPLAITAPATAGQWVKYTSVWNSGLTPPPFITIRIQNTTTTGCNDGVDFGIDDISFSAGCEYGSPGPLPNLGADFSICGKAIPFNISPNFDATTAASSDITYRWYKDGIEVTSGMGATFGSFSVNTPGKYTVCTDSAGSCPKSSILTISNSYSIDLGPDLALCNPTTAKLDAQYTGPGVSYQWYKNGTIIKEAISKTLAVTNPSTYSVTVHDPSCGDKSDTIIITTDAASPNDSTFCPITNGGKGFTHLSVTGTGKYKWWDAPSGGNVVATGNTFTTPQLTASTTYYVEDTSTFSLKVGPPAVGNGFSNVQSVGPGDSKNTLVFNALTDFRLDSITVLPYNYYCPTPATGNANIVNLIIYDASGIIIGQSTFAGACTGTGQPAAAMQVPVGINIPQGNGYQMKLDNGSTQIALFLNSDGSGGNPPSPELYHYPTSYSSAVEFVSNSSTDFNLYYKPDAIPGYFDWKITRGINCQRVPVTASAFCPKCNNATAPSAAQVDISSFCSTSTVSQITLTATGGSGDTLSWYADTCGDTRVAFSLTGAPVTIPAPSKTTTYYARWEALGCQSECVSVEVKRVEPPSTADAGLDESVCNATQVQLSASQPTIGKGAWSVVSGLGVLADTTDPATVVSGLEAGTVSLRWVTSNAPCPVSADTVIIKRDTLSNPILQAITNMPCATDTGIAVYTLTDRSAFTAYVWTTTGTASITSRKADTAFVSVGTSESFIKISETLGVCTLSDSLKISPVALPDVANAGSDINLCNTNNTLLAANTPANGTGSWSIISGLAVLKDVSDPKTQVSGIPVGNLVLQWTTNNTPCPVSVDTVVIKRDTLSPPIITGTNLNPCKSDSAVPFFTTEDHSAYANYTWSSRGGTFKISAQNADTVFIKTGELNDTLVLTETYGNCVLSDEKIITLSPNVQFVPIGGDLAICTNEITLTAQYPLFGKAHWIVKQGTAIFDDANDAATRVTGLLPGKTILAWSVEGCGGPVADELTITVNPSNLHIETFAPKDTLCFGVAREITGLLTGGSGKNLYIWYNTNLKTVDTTQQFVFNAIPTQNSLLYEVHAIDLEHLGCISNIDTVVIHAVPSQALWFNNLLTPNGDNKNDNFVIRDRNTHQILLPGSTLEVYNRWGAKIFYSKDYDNSWKASNIPDGVYYFNLKEGCGGNNASGLIQIMR